MSELKKITECILSDARTLRQNALSAAENKCTEKGWSYRNTWHFAPLASN